MSSVVAAAPVAALQVIRTLQSQNHPRSSRNDRVSTDSSPARLPFSPRSLAINSIFRSRYCYPRTIAEKIASVSLPPRLPPGSWKSEKNGGIGMRAPQQPLEYLVTASQASLEAFELAQLNRSANLRKELRDILDEWLQTEVDARVSRWILECRRAQNDDASPLPAAPRKPLRIGQLALAFLPQTNPPGARNPQIPAQAWSENGKCPPEFPVPGMFSPSQHVHTPTTSSMTSSMTSPISLLTPSPMTPPMTSKDAFASLRLLEKFLAPPAQSNDTENPQSIQSNARALSDEDPALDSEGPVYRATSSTCPNHAATARRRKQHGRARVRSAFPPTVRRAPHRCGRHHRRAAKQSVAGRAAWGPAARNRRQRSPRASTPSHQHLPSPAIRKRAR